ncbi:hypothetical protein Hokovirus_1_243 [Hokovirus HKV1]|uniref:Uncharacterized protein n=1 Tax=Hokovirus HKV1 TaxID=1977638 RepID=A0A1V0SFE5_9VIRU|nr:hypothetical protein Hokovirus_1_243 [Hokovirus HKV1]
MNLIKNTSLYNDELSSFDRHIAHITQESIINFLKSYRYARIYELEDLINNLKISDKTKDLLFYYSTCDYKIPTLLNITYSQLLESVLYYIISSEEEDKYVLLKKLDIEILATLQKSYGCRLMKTISVLYGYCDLVKINVSETDQIRNILRSVKSKYYYDNKLMKEMFIKELQDCCYSQESINSYLVYLGC